MEKKKETYTIMVLPNPTSAIYRFSISKKRLKTILYTTSIIALLLTIFIFNYISMAERVWELNALRKETTSQRLYIQSFMKTVDDFKEQMSRIKELDAKLRVITNLSPRAEETKPAGMGGREEASMEDPSIKETSLEETSLEERPTIEGNLVNEDLLRRIQDDLKRFKDQAQQQESSLKELMETMKERQVIWASTPSIWPADGFLTSGFGTRLSPFTEKPSIHTGIDIAARPGTPVIAAAGGRVAFEGYDRGLGKTIRIDHGYGIQTIYGHLLKINVKVGQRVRRGNIIGFVGNSGLSTGPHLHYEVVQGGTSVDPLRYILN